MSHLGLYGMLRLITRRENTPKSPMENRYRQFYISPKSMFKMAANDPPKCHVPSIPILTRPRYFGGRNSSIAVNIAVNSPPILYLNKSYLIPVKKRPNINNSTDFDTIENKIPKA